MNQEEAKSRRKSRNEITKNNKYVDDEKARIAKLDTAAATVKPRMCGGDVVYLSFGAGGNVRALCSGARQRQHPQRILGTGTGTAPHK